MAAPEGGDKLDEKKFHVKQSGEKHRFFVGLRMIFAASGGVSPLLPIPVATREGGRMSGEKSFT